MLSLFLFLIFFLQFPVFLLNFFSLVFPCAYKAWVFLKPAFIRSSVWSPCRGLYLYCLLCRITEMELIIKTCRARMLYHKENGKKPRGGRLLTINTASRAPRYQVQDQLVPLVQDLPCCSTGSPTPGQLKVITWPDTKPRHVPSPALVLRPPPCRTAGGAVVRRRGQVGRAGRRTVAPSAFPAGPARRLRAE